MAALGEATSSSVSLGGSRGHRASRYVASPKGRRLERRYLASGGCASMIRRDSMSARFRHGKGQVEHEEGSSAGEEELMLVVP
ncbi:hypothetical protein E2562_034984 [Oryza meyeriana var. granulata]|uniref:Uncharacterized protein n=1 Tax=Oryza meyeriana var. granulata TaxID=110450 RepID=A0A6G1CB93_9ORYZ|nr:hypothetical protein E2562_034984 [Oryza meyeriana var. granulata]